MGLAASQARFLAITARKADCEFRSMQIAQNKLSVTRELQAETEKYHNAMNAEMLVWDYDGSGSDLQTLSYNLMTRPSIYNNYNPYLVTDRGGRIIVSPEIAAAAGAAGIDPKKGGSRTEAAFMQFMKALAVNDVVSTQTVQEIDEIMRIVNNPSNEYLGLDGHTYSQFKYGALCPVPVYVKEVTNEDGSTGYEYVKPVLVNNPNLTKWNDEGYTAAKYYTGERNVQPAGTKIAYMIYTGTDYNKFGSPGDMVSPGNINDPYLKFVEYSGYDPNNGFGSEPMSKNALSGMNVSQLANALRSGKIMNAFQEIKLCDVNCSWGTGQLTSSDVKTWQIVESGSLNESIEDYKNSTLSDVLTGNVVLSAIHKEGEHSYDSDFTGYLREYLENAVYQLGVALGVYKQVKNPAKTDITKSILKDPANYKDAEYGELFRLAWQFTQDQFCGTPNTVEVPSKEKVAKAQVNARNCAEATNNVVFYKNTGSAYHSVSAVSLTNMIKYFLTYVTVLEDGFDSGYAAMDTVAQSNFVTDDPEFRWVTNDEETETNEYIMKSDFYQQLFNNICLNGYKTDQRIEGDNYYLEQMLKNGSYFISSLGNDGNYYQTRYNDAEYTLIKVVADEDAIAVAESEYNYAKIRLTAKEDKLDIDMKNIDMELSALTTEYEAVQNLINKSIEKTFKQFES